MMVVVRQIVAAAGAAETCDLAFGSARNVAVSSHTDQVSQK
jgi:hypothetical protein